MNNFNNSVDDVVECPLCMEPLEVDDLNFFPCTCGYQICRFCWHRIRTDENELCPACRKEYPENPADFKPLTQEEMIAFKSRKRQRDQQRKQKITENRKHLANVRVVQKNLVFVVGLPPRLADADILKKHEYFGKYGKIHKVVINPSTTYAGVQGPSASAYVTYVNNTDALRAIQSVNNIMIDGRLIKTSLGTTKYCSHFMKNQQCPKGDCMYLHDLGDPEASFTKEEMHQGKHQEYEKRLHDALIAASGAAGAGGLVTTTSSSKICENSKQTGILPSPSASINIAAAAASSSTSSTGSGSANGQQSKEAWPSLSVSPVNQKELSANAGGVGGSNKSKKERAKQEKQKNAKTKNKINNTNIGSLSTKEMNDSSANITESILAAAFDNDGGGDQLVKPKADKAKATNLPSNRSNQRKEVVSSTIKENEIKEFEHNSMPPSSTSPDLDNIDGSPSANSNSKVEKISSTKSEAVAERSLNSSSNSSSSCLMTTSDNTSPINESVSGKSSPNSFHENSLPDEHTKSALTSDLDDNGGDHIMDKIMADERSSKQTLGYMENMVTSEEKLKQNNYDANMDMVLLTANESNNDRLISNQIEKDIFCDTPLGGGANKHDDILADTISKLNLFDENSFFSSTPAVLQQSMLMRNKHIEDTLPNQLQHSGTMPNLPDLINGIEGGGYQHSANDWEEAFKNVMPPTNKQMEEKIHQSLLQHQLQQQHQHHHPSHHPHHPHHNQLKHQEDLLRLQEIQKRNSLLNSLSLSQINGAQNEFLSNSFLMGSDLNRPSNFLQQHQQHQLLQHQSNPNINENMLQNTLFGTNMSKFFDFHKNQQQKLQQHGGGGSGINENLQMMSLLESNRLNSQLMEQSLLTSQQQQHQKQKGFGKMDQHLQQQPPPHTSSVQSQQNQQFLTNLNADDDLGFDPFIETQKALAELIENEEELQNVGTTTPSKLIPHKPIVNNLQQQQQQPPHQQQQQQHMMDYMQRARMPPPGFNHVNNFGNFNALPRLQPQNNSKIMPFMNLSSNYTGSNGQAMQQQQQQQQQQQLQIPNNAWTTHLGNNQQHVNDQQQQAMRQLNSNPGNQKGFTGNDWTAMDPAILSFRQFSFPQQSQIAPPNLQPPQQQQDLFLQQLAQQQQQQQQPGFNSQLQHLGGGNVGGVAGIPNSILSSQQSSQAQVNANVQGMLEYLKARQF